MYLLSFAEAVLWRRCIRTEGQNNNMQRNQAGTEASRLHIYKTASSRQSNHADSLSLLLPRDITFLLAHVCFGSTKTNSPGRTAEFGPKPGGKPSSCCWRWDKSAVIERPGAWGLLLPGCYKQLPSSVCTGSLALCVPHNHSDGLAGIHPCKHPHRHYIFSPLSNKWREWQAASL